MFIFLWEVNFKIVVSAVKKNTAEIPPVMLFIAVVEQFNIFFIGFPDESTAIINLILGNRNAMVKTREDRRYCFGF